ncbi:hypothetical protein [Nocardia arizonensis]|uniref:hypothetical protein n=1 Tax=Nocardia arizonensis TaxID=1141647 RepID=UPI0006CFA75B|nr:hypothetical protein [Nocardia arizonensis]
MGAVEGFSERMRDRSVDEILDQGAAGMQYWIQLAPRYSRAFDGDGGNSLQRIEALYDEQRGMNLAKLEAAADSMNEMLTVASEQGTTQEQIARRLPSLWQGAAADAGIQLLNRQNTLAADDREKVRAAVDTIRATITPFRDAVVAKAELTLGLLHGQADVRVDGKAPEDIDAIIAGARTESMVSRLADGNTLAGKLIQLFPDLAATNSPVDFVQGMGSADLTSMVSDPNYVERIRDRCRVWLEKVFKVQYDDTVTTYLTQCQATDTAFETQYTTLAAVFAQLDDDPYPAPVGGADTEPSQDNSQNSPSQNSPSGNTPSGAGSPSGADNASGAGNPSGTTDQSTKTNPSSTNTPTANTPSTASTPSTADTPSTASAPSTANTPSTNLNTGTTNSLSSLQGLASINQIASTLTGAANSAAQTIGANLSSLGATIKDGIDDALEKVEQATGKNQADRPLAEFDIAGKHLTLEVGADGQPKLLATDADGTKHEYSVKLDEHGIPTLVDSVKSEHGAGEPAKDGSDSGASENGSEDKGGDAAPKSSEQPKHQNPTGGSGSHTGGGASDGDQGASSIPKVPPVPRGEEDGEHKPAPMPATGVENQRQVPDSGARLAEAGPL